MAAVTSTHDDLRLCLAAIPPCQLLGMTLLKQGCPLDVSRDVLREAVTEIIAYTGRCAAAAHHLRDLSPVPLTTIVFAGYGL